MNATLVKFGYPATLVRDYAHWSVLLRPAQATLGALILGAKSQVTAFSSLPPEAFAELALVTKDIEAGLSALRTYQRINYLMLMMVDPHVHFHVLPRYAEPQDFQGVSFVDPGWPGVPDLKFATAVPEDTRARMLQALQQAWPKA
ncbi:HIT family protein [Aestuariivirga sp.]|uniref:HIT family protein n=1 Tax=Aestuariivirga sp. TaxID=2650926 RepID=UPI0039E3AB1E